MSSFVTFYDEIMGLIVFTFVEVDIIIYVKKKNFYVNNVRRQRMNHGQIYETPVIIIKGCCLFTVIINNKYIYKHM